MSLEGLEKRNFQWFPDNQVKSNTNKFYLNMSKDKQLQIAARNSSIKRGNCEKF